MTDQKLNEILIAWRTSTPALRMTQDEAQASLRWLEAKGYLAFSGHAPEPTPLRIKHRANHPDGSPVKELATRR